jgi:hypothetical protein
MSRKTQRHRHHDHSFGVAPLPRGPFGAVTIHARTSAELVERNAVLHELVRSA